MARLVNTKALLDNVQSQIQDQSAELRARMLIWLNKIFQRLALERDWLCLQKSATLAVTSGTILLPSDYGRLVNVQALSPDEEGGFFLEGRHRLSDEEAYLLGTDSTATAPTGFVETATNITFKPGLSASSVALKYVQALNNYTDGTADTVWPIEFGNAVERKLLTLYYEYDLDERNGGSSKLDQDELRALKKWENRQIPLPRNSAYMRRG